ncbi:hypothetical protein ACFQZU_22595, partial [Streptomonospora algeriensis]
SSFRRCARARPFCACCSTPTPSCTPQLLAGLGRRVLVLGTVYFTGLVLEAIGADTESLFTV